MSAKRKAAIAPDNIAEKKLDEISASDFLAALEKDSVSLTVWPEKKKVELHREPETWSKFRVIDIIEVLRDKKKWELEKHPGYERLRDPIEEVINPAVYDRLVDRITNEVVSRMRR